MQLRRKGSPLLLLAALTGLWCSEGPVPQDRQVARAALEQATTRFEALAEVLPRALQLERAAAAIKPKAPAVAPSSASGGWRLPGPHRLQAELPAQAGGVTRISSGPVTLTLRSLGARQVEGAAMERAMVFSGAYPHADSIMVLEPDRVEEFILLRDERAPRRFEYALEVVRGRGVVRQLEHTVEVLDAAGNAWIRLAPLYLEDAAGTRHAVSGRLEGARLVVEVPPGVTRFPALLDPGWVSTNKMAKARSYHAAVLLNSGQVLVAGGGHTTAELFDPSTGTWTATGSSKGSGQLKGAAVLLASGEVMAVWGGVSAEVYDPLSGSWTATPKMTVSRAHRPGVVRLLSNKVLAAGGKTTACELYHPVSKTWTTTGSMPVARREFGIALLKSGQVLAAGGPANYLCNAEVYDPKTGKWTALGNFDKYQDCWDNTVTALASGKALIAGGYDSKIANIYDPSTGKIARIKDMLTRRFTHTATLLASGKLLMIGGRETSMPLQFTAKAEVYDETTGLWSAISPMPAERGFHSATVLPSGMILVAGGRATWFGSSSADASLYNPTSGAACAKASDCALGHCVDGVCCEVPCAGTCRVCVKQTVAGVTRGKCTLVPAGKPDTNAKVPCAGAGLCDGVGTCRKGDGVKCTSAFECGSGHCVDGVCCADACAATCKGCAVKGHLGVCWDLPRNAQDAVAKTPCSGAKACDGAGTCRGNYGAYCSGNTDCASDLCVDKTCCRGACTGPCRSCALPGKLGTCAAIKAGTDPEGECLGADPHCGGQCGANMQCSFPDIGKRCGTCKACDGAGRCTTTPPDDKACGVIDCDKLDTACRDYKDLVSNRCYSLGACKLPNDSTTCDKWAALSCADAGPPDSARADAKKPDATPSPPKDGTGDEGCSYARAGGSGQGHAAGWTTLALLVLGLRRRVKASRWRQGGVVGAALLLSAAAVSPGCGAETGPASDRGAADVKPVDQASREAAPPDAARSDSRPRDRGAAEAAPADLPVIDHKANEAAPADASGQPDAPAPPDGLGPLPACASPGKPCSVKNKCVLLATCGADKLCHPAQWTSCDDGLACTSDSCLGKGTCANVPQAGTCALVAPKGGKYVTQCFNKGAKHPTDPCLACDPGAGPNSGPATGSTSWAPASGGVCDDGDACTKGDTCVAGTCKGTDYSAACSDGLWCTADSCDGKGGCLTSQPKAGWCAIGKGCFKHGARHPAAACSYCDATNSPTAWSKQPNSCEIGPLCAASGQQHPGGCAQCVPGSSASAWTLKGNTHCLIDDTCRKSGAASAKDQCKVCDPARSTTAWSAVKLSCLINGKCYAKGTKHAGGCAVCDPATSKSTWTVAGTTHCLIGGACVPAGATPPQPGGCGSCQPKNDKYSYFPDKAQCKIAGKCISSGAVHLQGCATCDPSVSQVQWTPNTAQDCLVDHQCMTRCGAACVDLKASPTNCGKCGTACAAQHFCVGGACGQAAPSCHIIKKHIPAANSGVYSVHSGSKTFKVFCDMDSDGGGWTLVGRFSNADKSSWIDTGGWWYDRTTEAGNPTSRSENKDALSQAFWTVAAQEFKLSRTDAAGDAHLLLTTGGCLGGKTFRDKIKSLGDYRTKTWSSNAVRATCDASLGGNSANTACFKYATCKGNIGKPKSISFFADWSAGDGAVLMIGGGGSACGRADHGVAVTEENAARFGASLSRKDFGTDSTSGAKAYSLNLFVR